MEDTAAKLNAVIAAVGEEASPSMLATAKAAAEAAEAETAAAAALRDLLAPKTASQAASSGSASNGAVAGSGAVGTEGLAAAIEAAARFPRLQVHQAEELLLANKLFLVVAYVPGCSSRAVSCNLYLQQPLLVQWCLQKPAPSYLRLGSVLCLSLVLSKTSSWQFLSSTC